ncbi:MAG: hypothetical protein R2818_05910 [Flavobacteriales bacterium]
MSSNIATGNVWSPGGATTQTINATVSGSYSVTVTDGNGWYRYKCERSRDRDRKPHPV